MTTDLYLYAVMAVFAAGLVAWLAAALLIVLGAARAVRLSARRFTRRPTAVEGRCPGCGGTWDTCQCGTQRPQRGTTWRSR
ncbi:hypothetical protein [Streptomyces chumphonensis]|uniref:hypothetical protein n=1 Tax=Streptomyces chumphonensis TaxID=1214925 RepID=UPI003D75530F